MQNILDEIENPISLTEKEIFTEIWLEPRKVLRFINDHKYDKYVYILLIIAGISRAFDRAVSNHTGDKISLIGIVLLCVIMGGLLGWISYYIYAALISWTGKWVEGKGDTTSILRIIAYAMIPAIFSLALLVPQLAIYGNELFKSDGDIISGGLIANFIFYGSMLMEAVLGIYTIIFMVVGISEVQKFSNGKALLNLFMPILVIAIPIVLIFLMVKGI